MKDKDKKAAVAKESKNDALVSLVYPASEDIYNKRCK
jgi:hypothetical protein